MQLTSFTDYALRTLMYLAARPEKLCTVREIAEYYSISYNHLVKVEHRLAQLGYLHSAKGKGGGIRLACDATSLRLGDLVEQLEPHMALVECFNPEANSCKIVRSCQLQHYLHEAAAAFVDTLNKYTLADTVRNKASWEAILLRPWYQSPSNRNTK
jgi:Rrf2 family transcriptional regulator, nitric oxide-sensitive transcriptional repressor